MKKNYLFVLFVLTVLLLNTASIFATSTENESSLVCAQGDLTLDITFGNNPGYLTWVIRDSNGNGLIAQVDYSSQLPNSTFQSTINTQFLTAGDYNFTIVSNHGTGMEGGSYMVSYGGNVLAQGSNFTYSDATSFCFISPGAGNNDVTPPTDPANLLVGNTTSTTADLSWDWSTDSQSPLVYGIVVNSDFGNVITTATPSYTMTNLTPGVNYSVAVIAADSWGNLSNATNTALVNTGLPPNCANNNLTLQLNFDANPQEISWTISNAVGGTVAYGNSYSGVSATIPVNIPVNGDHVFVIQDMGGDGNTNYTLSDGSVTVATGTVFPYSESTQFCVGSTNGAVLDIIRPSDPRNLWGSNVTQTTVDLSWSPSSDNFGVTQYAIFQNDVFLGDVPFSTTSITVPGLQPGTTYTYKIVARDLVGNISGESNSVTIITQGVFTSTVLHEGYFEQNLDGWVDGGNDCVRSFDTARSYENNYSVRLRDNSGSASSMTLSQSVSGYDAVEISFFFKARGMDNGDDFWVRYFDGNNWVTVASFTRGPDFRNNRFYEVNVVLSDVDYAMSSGAQFRIQNDATVNNDRIYVDQTKLVGYTASSYPSSSSITEVSNLMENNSSRVEGDLQEISSTSDLIVYPNPATDYFSLKGSTEHYVITVYSVLGEAVKRFENVQEQYFIGDLAKGMYLIIIEEQGDRKVIKLLKQ